MGEVTLKVDGVGSYLSNQILIFWPFLTVQLKPLLTTCWADIILLHKISSPKKHP